MTAPASFRDRPTGNAGLERAFRDRVTGTQHAFISEKTQVDVATLMLGLADDTPAL